MIDRVADDIFRLNIPIPFPLRTVNIYVLVGKDGWALFDAAIGTEEARVAVMNGLASAGLALEKLQAIVLSHAHPDHVGLSGELQANSGAIVYMHPIDEKQLQLFWNGQRIRAFGQASQFFKPHGMPTEPTHPAQVPPEVMQRAIRIPPHEAFTLIEDQQEIELVGERYKVFWVPGHSDGQIMLFRERDGALLAADHVLPRITPNIGLYSEHGRINPLEDYLESLRKVEHLPASIVLPGHGEPFPDLATRVQELIEHHAEREQQIQRLLAGQPQHAYYLTRHLFGERLKSQDSWRMAMAETLAHLEHLRFNGQVTQQKSDGVIFYAAV